MKIVVGASSFSRTVPGCEVILNPYGRKMTEDEIIAQLEGADGLLAGLEPLNSRVFSACPGLKAIARVGAGMDNVDLEAAKRRGIKVSGTPDAPTYAVAEMTMAALLTIARRIIPANADMHGGVWQKQAGMSLEGAAVLLIGYGRIGKRFAQLLEPFGARLMICDPAYAQIRTDLKAMLAQADVISLHASGKDVILGPEQFPLLKNSVIILNSARGGLVDEDALCRFLDENGGAYYWADVFCEEPYAGPLTQKANAVLTPHIATYTALCREQMEAQAVSNLLRDLGVRELG